MFGIEMEMFSLKNVIEKFQSVKFFSVSPQTRRQVSAYE